MKFMIGKKIGMTQIFQEDGTVTPVTLVEATPNKVVQVKTVERDGYSAVQVASGASKHVNKAQKGAWKDMGAFRDVREYRAEDLGDVEVGSDIDVSAFEIGEKVDVVGTSKGRGFQGVVKRHGFHGQSSSHGTKDQVRMPGSIGATGPQRVFKGVRMPGQMGDKRVTVKNLVVADIRVADNVIALRGAVPGARNSLVIIKAS
jgi:large subunit ribosomal protein L3